MDPFPAWMERLWDEWILRIMVLVSLILQVILIILGNRRRYIRGIWIRIIVWFAYLMADSVATVALGKLSSINETGDNSVDPNDVLRALWAPLLLLHLGGPDTITAYSLEDNQLWLRHLLGLFVQVGVVIYIFLRYWNDSRLSIMTFPLFLAGIIKYGERIWVLRSTNSEHPKSTIQLKKDEIVSNHLKSIGETYRLVRAYMCFETFKPHVANYVCSSAEIGEVMNTYLLNSKDSGEMFFGKSVEETFDMADYELGFMYDALYTKAPIVYKRAGRILRFISFFSTLSTLLGFSIITKHHSSSVDVFITYLLLVGAVLLDIYAVVLLFYSDWAILLMVKHLKNSYVDRMLKVLAPLSQKKWKRWSKSLVQFNLLSFCLKEKPLMKFIRIIFDFFGLGEKLEKAWYETYMDVPEHFNAFVTGEMKKISEQIAQIAEEQPFTKRGTRALEKYKIFENLKWSVEADFDESIIYWHIATDICYYKDQVNSHERSRMDIEMSKLVSDYMMYLLVMHPYMLSISTWNFMFQRACNQIKDILKTNEMKRAEEEEEEKLRACNILLEQAQSSGVYVRLEEPRHPLQGAVQLAKTLMEQPNRWEILSTIWVEMMCYAATHCPDNYHAQQLRRGGEFLTLIWLLLTNFGISQRSIKCFFG